MATSSPDPRAEDPFLQRRVTYVLRAVAALLFVFLVYTALEALVEEDWVRFDSTAAHIHAAVMLFLAAAAIYCGRGRRTVREIYLADATGLLATGVMLAVLSSYSHVGYRPEFTMLTGTTIVVVGRSAFVPSTTLRTAVLCGLLAIPIGVLTWTTYVGYVPPTPAGTATEYPGMSPAGVTVYILLWWTASSVLASSVSRVIYGLRREVDRARRVGQYALEDKIGEGGMGQVYRASHAMLRRPTAIKLLSGAGEEQLRRFEREVQLTASLTHPNTIAVFDYGRTPDSVFYYAMEYLDGWNLEELVDAHGPQPAARVIHILRQVCGALAEAHDAGLIHRDIKPANIILCERGGVSDVAKVLDFGLVKALESNEADVAETSTNAVMGTPLYMSPEAIAKPEEVDARSDLYALGAVGYFMLTGHPVFVGDTVVEVCGHHLHSEPKPVSEWVQDAPADLEAVLRRCLEKKRGDRPRDATELAAALAACGAAEAWTSTASKAWWKEHGSARKGAAPERTSVRDTVAVSLAERMGSS